MTHSETKPPPINLYQQRGDREVWERAQKDADADGRSLSRHVVAVLREQQAGLNLAERRVVAEAMAYVTGAEADGASNLRDLVRAVDTMLRARKEEGLRR